MSRGTVMACRRAEDAASWIEVLCDGYEEALSATARGLYTGRISFKLLRAKAVDALGVFLNAAGKMDAPPPMPFPVYRVSLLLREGIVDRRWVKALRSWSAEARCS